jgi:hypothetical protein
MVAELQPELDALYRTAIASASGVAFFLLQASINFSACNCEASPKTAIRIKRCREHLTCFEMRFRNSFSLSLIRRANGFDCFLSILNL